MRQRNPEDGLNRSSRISKCAFWGRKIFIKYQIWYNQLIERAKRRKLDCYRRAGVISFVTSEQLSRNVSKLNLRKDRRALLAAADLLLAKPKNVNLQ